MIIGSGLLAQSFIKKFLEDENVCIYAAGVSNSSCGDLNEFLREKQRLSVALHNAQYVDCFVYFGTCSVGDPDAQCTPYVTHKLAMEKLASTHPRYLILRLPQVAGKTPNPYTLLNFLYAHISRGEVFSLWNRARRNIIDVDDVAAISGLLIEDSAARKITFNIANPVSYTMSDIVAAMERIVGKRAIYNLTERYSQYPIDTSAIRPLLDQARVSFGDNYLETVIGKYYAKVN